jgi:hypothetical protein
MPTLDQTIRALLLLLDSPDPVSDETIRGWVDNYLIQFSGFAMDYRRELAAKSKSGFQSRRIDQNKS